MPKKKKTPVFKSVALTVLPVSYKNQKNAWMDSEVFRCRFFDDFLHFSAFFGNPTAYQLRLSWRVGTLLCLLTGFVDII